MRYIDGWLNERQKKRLYLITTGIFAFLFVASVTMEIRDTGDPTQRLIPQHWDADDGPLEVTASGKESPEYITHIAVADTRYLTNWTPENARDQHARFANRLCPAFFAEQKDELMRLAERYADDERSQELHITRTEGSDDGLEARISGRLRHYHGKEPIQNRETTWVLHYRYDQPGLPCITSIEEKKGDEGEEQEE